MELIWGLVGGKTFFGRDGLATLNIRWVPFFRGKRNHCRDHFSDEYVWSQEQSAIPQLRSHDSRTKTTRFHNQTTRFRNQNWRASTTKTGALPQPNSHDSTTKLPRFHNQNLRIPQPKSQDSTTKLSGIPASLGRLPLLTFIIEDF